MDQLVTQFYMPSHPEMAGSSASGSDRPPYPQQPPAIPHSPENFIQNSEMPKPNNLPQGQQVEMPFLPSNSFQPGPSSAMMNYSPVQHPREMEQPHQYWSRPAQGIRWTKNVSDNPASQDDLILSSPTKTRRPSLKTCELEEAGLDFPGCYVLVPFEDPANSDSQAGGTEPSVVSTKKSQRRPMEESERAAIKMNRKNGVCLRCKIFKERVGLIHSCSLPRNRRLFADAFSRLPRNSAEEGFPATDVPRLSIGGIFASQRFLSTRGYSPEVRLMSSVLFTRDISFANIYLVGKKGLWKARLSPLLQNILEWLPESTHPVEYIQVSNGYSPMLRLPLQRFTPIDPSLLEHIVWREVGRAGFARIPSSAVGISTEIPFDKLDHYFDDHIPDLVEEVVKTAGPEVHEQTFAQTLRVAYEYSTAHPENVRGTPLY